MTSDTRSPAEIEREIERERAGLTNTLEDLQHKFSVESIARQVSDQFRDHGGDIGRSISDAVKRNPVALTLTGVGLAWLMLGDRSGPRGARDDDGPYGRLDDRYGEDRIARSGVYGRPATRSPQPQGRMLGPQPGDATRPYYSGRYSRHEDLPSWAQGADDDHGNEPSAGARVRDAAAQAGESVADAGSSAAGATRRAGAAVATTAKDAAGTISDAGTSVAEGTRNLAASASEKAATLRDRLAEGTENLTEEARNRVIAARERAIQARDAAMDYGRRGRDMAVDVFEEQPLIAGALALAVGAAIGAALPRSRTEDRYLGEYSDDLMEEAERIFEEEKQKMSKVVEAGTKEARKVAEEGKEAMGEAAQSAIEGAKSSGERIADAAQDEAKKQNLGDVTKS